MQRVPLGCVLVIGPSNYPLFLPGVQVLQALAAGNAVCWKPGRGGAEVARLFELEMAEAGLPPELLRVTDDSLETGRAVVAAGADKVFFTGSASAGRAVMRQLADAGTPSVMELSGCSSVIVMPGSDLARVTAAVVFGTRLNGSATCMAPRRILVMGDTKARRDALVRRLQDALATVDPVRLSDAAATQLRELTTEARTQGATLLGELSREQKPILLVNARPSMRIAQTDIFAPVLSVIDVTDDEDVAAAERLCPLALTVSIFGDEQKARRLARDIAVGTVVINDVIVPTADPRLPFGGRRASGFGVTRGAEGLLEMTAIRNVIARRGDGQRQYEETGESHTRLFDGLILAGHAGTWRQRWRGFKQMVQVAGTMKPKKREQHDGE
ncbi:putative aldehyde dehydrogenase (NAD+) [Granulicella sibirica]|uniref:Putative aldehyde dehydrogenase (NAD+) n=1 Tax=Granulicella sibirica TaxID=2479048 RepID=A0A4Q0T0W9_9BACT|nr:putative aldehyde dehydrogenase (NAD+) [Granulicella sibirica]